MKKLIIHEKQDKEICIYYIMKINGGIFINIIDI